MDREKERNEEFSRRISKWKDQIKENSPNEESKRACTDEKKNKPGSASDLIWESIIRKTSSLNGAESPSRIRTMRTAERNAGVAPDSTNDLDHSSTSVHSSEPLKLSQIRVGLSANLYSKKDEETGQLSKISQPRKYVSSFRHSSLSKHSEGMSASPLASSRFTDKSAGVAGEIVEHLEKKIAQQESQIHNYREVLRKKSDECRMLHAELRRIHAGREKSHSRTILDSAVKALALISEISYLEKIPEVNTAQRDTEEIQLENMNLKNVVAELIEKIREIKNGRVNSPTIG